MVNSTYLGLCMVDNQPTDPISICIATMYILFGIVYTLFGYRCFKAVMFLTGFIFASVIVYLICIQEKRFPTYANAGIAICAGLLFGLITMLVQYFGLFMTGFHTGLAVALAGLVAADQLNSPPSTLTSVASLLGVGTLFAVLNLYWQKGYYFGTATPRWRPASVNNKVFRSRPTRYPQYRSGSSRVSDLFTLLGLTIFGTCVYGGGLVTFSVDYLSELLRTVEWLWKRQGPPCYPVLALWPTVLCLGLAVQISLTPHHHHHNAKHGGRGARTREQRAELRQNKYRYLYQVRTAHGDIISQNYVQAIQNKVVGPGETSTLESDATHLTMLPDGQTDFSRGNYYR